MWSCFSKMEEGIALAEPRSGLVAKCVFFFPVSFFFSFKVHGLYFTWSLSYVIAQKEMWAVQVNGFGGLNGLQREGTQPS